MAFLKNALMCIDKEEEKKVKLNNHECLPILMLLIIILVIFQCYLSREHIALSYKMHMYAYMYIYVNVCNAVYNACLLNAVCCFI